MIMSSFRFFLAASFLVALIAGCGVSDPLSPQFVVASGKHFKITRAELEKAEADLLQQFNATLTQIPADKKANFQKYVLEELILEKVLLHAARPLETPEVKQRIADQMESLKIRVSADHQAREQLLKKGLTWDAIEHKLRKEHLIRELVKKNVPETPEPSPVEVEKLYQQNLNKLKIPRSARVSQILILVPAGADAKVKAEKKKRIEEARQKILKGAEFLRIAQEYSEDKGSMAKGGDMGWVREGEMPKEFDKVIFTQKIGEISPVFETPYGFHFVRVGERQDPQTMPIEQARAQLIPVLKKQKGEEMVRDYFNKLKQEAGVVIHLKQPEIKTPLVVPTSPTTN